MFPKAPADWAIIDRTLTAITTPVKRGPGSNGNKDIGHFYQSSRTGVLPSDGV